MTYFDSAVEVIRRKGAVRAMVRNESAILSAVRSVFSKSINLAKQDRRPFVAAVVDQELLSITVNGVAETNDPTAHAEMLAIREAARVRSSPQLPGGALIASHFPCPMCLCGAYWADIGTVVYLYDTSEADRLGFRDSALYQYFSKPSSCSLPIMIATATEHAGKWQLTTSSLEDACRVGRGSPDLSSRSGVTE